MRESDNGTCPVKKVFWTLIELFCTKRLFSRETAFFPDYLTRDKNGKNSFSKKFRCSYTINKFTTGNLCMILIIRQNISKYRVTIGSYLLRIENKSVTSKEARKNLKGIRYYPQKIRKSSPEHLILPFILPRCLEFIFQDYTPEPFNIPRKKTNFLKST